MLSTSVLGCPPASAWQCTLLALHASLSLVQPASRVSLSSPELCFQYINKEGTASDALLSQINFSGSRLSTDLQLSDEIVALKVARLGSCKAHGGLCTAA